MFLLYINGFNEKIKIKFKINQFTMIKAKTVANMKQCILGIEKRDLYKKTDENLNRNKLTMNADKTDFIFSSRQKIMVFGE